MSSIDVDVKIERGLEEPKRYGVLQVLANAAGAEIWSVLSWLSERSGMLKRFLDEAGRVEEGPIKIIDPDKVPKDPPPMLQGFEWVTMDLLDDGQVDTRS